MKKWTLWLTLLLCGTLAAQGRYNYFNPGGALSCTGPCLAQAVNLSAGTFVTGNLPLTNLQTIASSSFLANASGSATTPAATNPLAAANLMSAVLSVFALSTTNITTPSGSQTIDGVVIPVGQVVLLTVQTTAPSGSTCSGLACSGLWVVNAGAWTRPANFPSGYVINANCDLLVMAVNGTTNGGHYWHLVTLDTGTVQIDTTNQNWLDKIPLATASKAGVILGTGNLNTGNLSRAWTVSNTANIVNAFDCLSPNGSGAPSGVNLVDLEDNGNLAGVNGGCFLEETTTGHALFTGTGSKPTASTGTVSNGSSDNKFTVTGITAATSVTITFNHGFTVAGGPPSCGASTSTSLATAPFVSSLTGTGPWTAVTFTFPALTGTLYGHCL